MPKEIIQFDQAMFESKLDAMVREKVTELLNAMPDASGGRDRQRREIRAFRRTEGVPGRPLRPEPDRQGRQARAQGAEIEGRPVRVRDDRTLPQTRGKRRGGADRHVPGRRVHQAGRRHRPVAVGRPHAVPDIERQAQARVRRDRRVAPERLRTTTYPHMHLYIIPLFSIKKKRPIHNKSIISHRPMHYIVFILLLTMMLNSADKDIYIFSNRKHLQHTYHHGNSNSNNIPIWSLQPNDHSLNRQKHCCRNNQ